jgi:anti-anti-sigma regulatory factor
MKSEALDIAIQSRGKSIWLLLSGPFHNEQAANIREKITGLIHDGNRQIVIVLEKVTEMDDAVVPMFMSVVNDMKGKNGDIEFIFRNATVSRAFSSCRNLCAIFPDEKALAAKGLLKNIRRQGTLLSRKTGIRLSRPVAIFLLVVLCGWFLSLAFIIDIQRRAIREQESEISELTKWKQEANLEIEHLEERLRPLKQLGLAPDTLPQK